MMKETEDIVHMSLDFLPLKSCANIIEGIALRLEWGDIVPKCRMSYIVENLPFHYFHDSRVEKRYVANIHWCQKP